ncbi:Midasin (Dynein-related AAA-ATPase MDN1) (MIDAS-containing protein) [Durusdinium trenchii]|uniref:Midasin (Dynein-related AAA-ATPase MDN1) (MIDAS-containing protein) n=1 Tax=Durusdinium trenchii TaxID=1381693 RepID=A0ABP0QJE8_9DINO
MPDVPPCRVRGKSAPRGRSPNAKALKKAAKANRRDGSGYVTPPPRPKKRDTSSDVDSCRQKISFGKNSVFNIEPENKAPDLKEADAILNQLKDTNSEEHKEEKPIKKGKKEKNEKKSKEAKKQEKAVQKEDRKRKVKEEDKKPKDKKIKEAETSAETSKKKKVDEKPVEKKNKEEKAEKPVEKKKEEKPEKPVEKKKEEKSAQKKKEEKPAKAKDGKKPEEKQSAKKTGDAIGKKKPDENEKKPEQKGEKKAKKTKEDVKSDDECEEGSDSSDIDSTAASSEEDNSEEEQSDSQSSSEEAEEEDEPKDNAKPKGILKKEKETEKAKEKEETESEVESEEEGGSEDSIDEEEEEEDEEGGEQDSEEDEEDEDEDEGEDEEDKKPLGLKKRKRDMSDDEEPKGKERGKEKKEKEVTSRKKKGTKEHANKKDKKKKEKNEKKEKSEKNECSDDEKALEKAEELLPNSTKNRAAWQSFQRWLKNSRRCPAKIVADTRRQLFADYLESGKDVKQVQARFEDRMIQAQRTTLRYGFRNETWLIKHHGERRARKIQERKKQLGLTIPDPEFPGEVDELLYWVMIEFNLDDVKELRRVTEIEMSGQHDSDGLKAFVEAGGCLDGKQHLSLGDLSGQSGMKTLTGALGSGGPKTPKPKGNKKSKEAR